MRKILVIGMVLCVIFGFGCGDDTTINEAEKDVDGIEQIENTDEIYFPCKDKYNLPEKAVTVILVDEEDHLQDMEPEMVAKRMHEHALSALDQCFEYGQVEYAYSYAMTKLNTCNVTVHTPETIEEWFFEYMRKVVGYDPLRICPGGCGDSEMI